MSDRKSAPDRGTADELRRLLAAVERARAQVAAGRGAPSRAGEDEARRHELLAALERYAAAVAAVGAPLPYRIRDELHLYRRLDRRR